MKIIKQIPKPVWILLGLIIWFLLIFAASNIITKDKNSNTHKKNIPVKTIPVNPPKVPDDISNDTKSIPGKNLDWADLKGVEMASKAVGLGLATYEPATAQKLNQTLKQYLTPELLNVYFAPSIGTDVGTANSTKRYKQGMVTGYIPSQDPQTGARNVTVFYKYKFIAEKSYQSWYAEFEFAPNRPLIVGIKQGQDRSTPLPTPLD